jgi:hypothetical protein
MVCLDLFYRSFVSVKGYFLVNADLRRRTDEVISRLTQLRDSL